MAKKRRSRKEWKAFVAEYRDSGLSREEFAKQRGLKPRTFSWWVTELSHDREPRPSKSSNAERVPEPPLRALPVTVIDGGGEAIGEALEVVFGDVRVCFPAGTDAVYVGQVFLELRTVS